MRLRHGKLPKAAYSWGWTHRQARSREGFITLALVRWAAVPLTMAFLQFFLTIRIGNTLSTSLETTLGTRGKCVVTLSVWNVAITSQKALQDMGSMVRKNLIVLGFLSSLYKSFQESKGRSALWESYIRLPILHKRSNANSKILKAGSKPSTSIL